MGKYGTIVYLPVYLQEFEVTAFCGFITESLVACLIITNVGIIHDTYRVDNIEHRIRYKNPSPPTGGET